MTMKYFLFAILALTGMQAYTQKGEEIGIRTTIDQFFTGMRQADSAMIAATISPTAVFQTIVTAKDGSTTVATESVADLLQALGKPHKEVYDEQIQYGTILVDANMAAVWTPYKFYLGKTFSHCGVNSFQMVKINNSWKIQYIIDTRRKDGCIAVN